MRKKLTLILALAVLLNNTSFVQAKTFLQNPSIGGSFGVQIKHNLTTEDDLKNIRDAGFGLVRFDIAWTYAEPEYRKFNWGPYDKIINALRKNNLRSVIVLRGGNKIYSGLIDVNPENYWGNKVLPPSPASTQAIEAFAYFATQAVKRYGGKDIIWEIWNEPDSHFWVPVPAPETYTQLALTTCRAIRSVHADATIIGPAVAQLPGEGIPSRNTFMEPLLKSKDLTCLDGLSLHPYRGLDAVPESVIKDYDEVRTYLKKVGPSEGMPPPLVSSEWGYTLTKVTAAQQADYVLRSHLSNLMAGVSLSIWYEWRDSYDSQPRNSEAHFGLVTSSRAQKKSYLKLRQLLVPIQDAVIEKVIAAGQVRSLYGLILRHPDGRRDIAVWLGKKDESDLTVKLFDGSTSKEIIVSTTPLIISVMSSDIRLETRGK